MEGKKLSDLFENQIFVLSDEAHHILNQLFNSSLIQFQEEKYEDWGPQFILIYQYLSTKITFGSDRGDFIYSLEINGEKINLRNFDLEITNAILLSEKNICYVFNVITRYLEENELV